MALDLSSVREQLSSVLSEVGQIRQLSRELLGKVQAETKHRQTFEASLNERIRSLDLENYEQALAGAAGEIQIWRESVEEDRELWKSIMKKEIQEILSEQINSMRKAVDSVETRYQDVTGTLTEEIQRTSTWKYNIHEMIAADKDERNQTHSFISTQREDVQKIERRVVEIENMRNALARTDGESTILGELTEANLSKMEASRTEMSTFLSQEQYKVLQDTQEGLDNLKKEVFRLSGQVNDAPQVLLELAVQLQTVQQDLSTETTERNIATDNLTRKLDLASTVFNVESRQELRSNAEDQSESTQKHEQQLRLIFDQLDSLANTQLVAMREQLANNNKQFALEQAERKSDSEMVWSSMQSLHGHLVQFISQPPAPAPAAMTYDAHTPTGARDMPASQRSLGGSRMPRSRSASPGQKSRLPPLSILSLETRAARPRTQLVHTAQPVTLQATAVNSSAATLLRNYVPPGPMPVQQVWTQSSSSQEMTPGQNISFARHLLKS